MRSDPSFRSAWCGGQRRWVSLVVLVGGGVTAVALAVLLSLLADAPPASAATSVATVAAATDGRPAVFALDAPDPATIRVGTTYYTYSTNSRGIRLPVLVSPDLVHWTVIAEGLPEVGDWAVDQPGQIWAPYVTAIDGGYRLYYSAPERVTRRKCIGTGFSLSPRGPFVDANDAPLVCEAVDGDAIDPTVYDHGGTKYLMWKGDRDPAGYPSRIWSQALGPHGTSLVGGRNYLLVSDAAWEHGVVEGPSMVFEGGRYLLFYSGGDWRQRSYATGYAVCEGPAGPCTKVTTSAPWMQENAYGWGLGGQEFIRDTFGQLWMVHHGWTGAIGYSTGGLRSLFIERVTVEGGAPTRRSDLQPGGPMDPLGRVDGYVSSMPNQIEVWGWALDPDGTASITVDIHVDGQFKGRATANDPRPDVGQAYPTYGSAHGFHVPITGLSGGVHEVCVWGMNVGLGGTWARMMCTTIDTRATYPVATATHPDGRLEVFAADATGRLTSMRQVSPGGAWGPWVSTGLAAVADPVLGRSADGRLEVFGVDWRGGLVHAWQLSVNGPWSGWRWTGVYAKGRVALGTSPDGRLELFATEPGGGLIHRWQLAPSGTWSAFQWMGIFAGGAPVVGKSSDGRLELFVPDWRGGLVHTWQLQVNGVWSQFQWTGIFAKGAPALGTSPDGRLELFVSDQNGGLVHRWQLKPNGVWSAWTWRGVFVNGPPVVGRHQDGRLEILVQDPRNGLIRAKQVTPNGPWSAWSWMGVFVAEVPAFGTNANGAMVLVADTGSSTLLWAKEAGDPWGWTAFAPLVPGAA